MRREETERRAPVIQPLAKDVLRAQLRDSFLVRRFRGMEVYVVTHAQAPQVVEEIGRIREEEFRREGGGTGLPTDIDDFDVGENAYRQLVAWDPGANEIVSMYRYLAGDHIEGALDPALFATSELFEFSTSFRNGVLPFTIEVGRSVVNRAAKKKAMGLYAIWAGIGAVIAEHPKMRFFFGKITTTSAIPLEARRLLFAFWSKVFPPHSVDVSPRSELRVEESDLPTELFCRDLGVDHQVQVLAQLLKRWELQVPLLMRSYIGLTHEIQSYGTAVNPKFGDAFETAILLPIEHIQEKPRRQFIESYQPINSKAFHGLG